MIIRAGGARFDVDAVIFDKDGTLIDLLASWSPAGQAWIDVASGGDAELAESVLKKHLSEAARTIVQGMEDLGAKGQEESMA